MVFPFVYWVLFVMKSTVCMEKNSISNVRERGSLKVADVVKLVEMCLSSRTVGVPVLKPEPIFSQLLRGVNSNSGRICFKCLAKKNKELQHNFTCVHIQKKWYADEMDKMCFHIRLTAKLRTVETQVGITGLQTYNNEINDWHNPCETQTPCCMFP